MGKSRKTYTPEERQRIIKKIEKLNANGTALWTAIKQAGISGETYYRWTGRWNRKKFDAKRKKAKTEVHIYKPKTSTELDFWTTLNTLIDLKERKVLTPEQAEAGIRSL